MVEAIYMITGNLSQNKAIILRNQQTKRLLITVFGKNNCLLFRPRQPADRCFASPATADTAVAQTAPLFLHTPGHKPRAWKLRACW